MSNRIDKSRHNITESLAPSKNIMREVIRYTPTHTEKALQKGENEIDEKPRKMFKKSITNDTETGISIGQDAMLGVGGMETLPPELLQKIREVLAVGIARSIIAKSIADLQSQG